jgi:peptide/nickel transport system substrate-binding protein
MSTVLALALAACGGTTGSPGASPGEDNGDEIDQITWAMAGGFNNLFVPRSWSVAVGQIMSLAQEGLLAFGDDLSLEPAVAESWEQTDDTTYVYTLREGVKFSDGSDVTVDDVVFSMQMHADEAVGSQLGAFYTGVESIEASGDREITVTLAEPNAQFQYTVAHMAGFIFKQSQLEESPDDIGTPSVLPIGTGPYRVVEYRPDEGVTLERNEHYWGEAPDVARVEIRFIPDSQARQLALRGGEVDGSFDVPLGEIETWDGIDGVSVLTTSSLGVYLLTMDQDTPPFDDVHVRRAFNYALDREGLVSALLQGRGEPAITVNPPGMWAGVQEEEEVRAGYEDYTIYSFDMEAAAEELSQSSVPDGFEVSVQTPSGYPELGQMALNLSENLSEIGVTLNVTEVDDNQWLNDYFAHEDLGLQVMSYFPDFADPANYPFLFLHSSNATANAMNGSNYSNPDVDAALDVALRESDPAVRAEALHEALRIAAEDAAIVTGFWPDTAIAISDEFAYDGFTAFYYNQPWLNRGFHSN